MTVIGWIVFGLIVGALAKLVMPGRDPGGIIVTMLLGIAGSLLGGFIGRAAGMYGPVDSERFPVSAVDVSQIDPRFDAWAINKKSWPDIEPIRVTEGKRYRLSKGVILCKIRRNGADSQISFALQPGNELVSLGRLLELLRKGLENGLRFIGVGFPAGSVSQQRVQGQGRFRMLFYKSTVHFLQHLFLDLISFFPGFLFAFVITLFCVGIVFLYGGIEVFVVGFRFLVQPGIYIMQF